MNQKTQTQRLTISLTLATVEALRELAVAHGLVTSSGRQAGEGNISGLLAALARGDLVVFRKEAIWQKGAHLRYDRDDTALDSGLQPSGDPTLCALTPDGELVELIPILESAEIAP